ncbi:MAG: hypothetical protein ACLQK4_13725 [Acidimicrobiales bacterium]
MSSEAPVATPSRVSGDPDDVAGDELVPRVDPYEATEGLLGVLGARPRKASLRETKTGC